MKYISLVLSLALLFVVIDAMLIHPEFLDEISLSGVEYGNYFDQVRYRYYESEEGDLYGEVNLKISDGIINDSELTIFFSDTSFNDAYQKGEGNTFVNGTELYNGEYFFVIEVFNIDKEKSIFLKKVTVSDGLDRNISIGFDDDIRNRELLGIEVDRIPRNTNFLSNNNISLEGVVLTLVFDVMYLDVEFEQLEPYNINAFLVDGDKVNSLDYDSLISADFDGQILYLGDDVFNKVAEVMPLRVDSEIKNYGKYGKFFTEDTEIDALITDEARKSFNFFWDYKNNDPNTKGFGLVPTNVNQGSDAEESGMITTGSSMLATIIAMENGWIEPNEGYKYITEVLNTISNMENFLGFYYDYFDIETGEKLSKSKISLIDSSIFFASILTVGEYFGGYIQETCNEIYLKASWHVFYASNNSGNIYNYYSENYGFDSLLEKYDRQLLSYILMAGNPDVSFAKVAYDSFERNEAEGFYYSWYGGLNSHYIPHMFVDFRHVKDEDGINWFENTIRAVENSRIQTNFLTDRYEAFKIGWGLGASDSPNGYKHNMGTAPSGYANNLHYIDGTIPSYVAVAAVVFTPEEALNTFLTYRTNNLINGEYGLYSAFNLDENWSSFKYNGKEKGAILTSLTNYKSNMIWNLFMQTEEAQLGLNTLGFSEDHSDKEYDKYFDPETELYYNVATENKEINNIENVKDPENFKIEVFEKTVILFDNNEIVDDEANINNDIQ